MLQIALSMTDKTIVYAVSDSYRINMPKLRTWIENVLLDVEIPREFPIRSLGCQNFVLINNKITKRTDTVPDEMVLLNLKYHAVDKVNMKVNGHRFANLNKLLLQPQVYDLKVAEATRILQSKDASSTETEFPLLAAEAKGRDLPIETLARMVLLAKEDLNALLIRTEVMRTTTTHRITEAKTSDDVLAVLSDFDESFHNRLF